MILYRKPSIGSVLSDIMTNGSYGKTIPLPQPSGLETAGIVSFLTQITVIAKKACINGTAIDEHFSRTCDNVIEKWWTEYKPLTSQYLLCLWIARSQCPMTCSKCSVGLVGWG